MKDWSLYHYKISFVSGDNFCPTVWYTCLILEQLLQLSYDYCLCGIAILPISLLIESLVHQSISILYRILLHISQSLPRFILSLSQITSLYIACPSIWTYNYCSINLLNQIGKKRSKNLLILSFVFIHVLPLPISLVSFHFCLNNCL